MSDYAPACKYFTFSSQMVQFGSQNSTQSKEFDSTVSNIGDPLSKKPRICENNAGASPFAHGVRDLRKALPNLQKVAVNEHLCRMFYSGKECTYGNNCRFLHVSPGNFKKHLGQYRESSAVSIGTTRAASSGGHRSGFKKRRLCNKWEPTGGCPYGKLCHFAHGQEELEKSEGHIGLASGIVPTKASKSLPMGKDGIGTNHKHEAQAMHCMFKWKALKKIRGIYADWIEDMHLLHSSLSKVEN